MSITAGTLGFIESAFRDLDLSLPKPYVKGLADVAADRSLIETVRGRDDAALADAVLIALRGGKDPADSEDVRRELARQQLYTSQVGNIAARRLDDRRAELLAEHADVILSTMGKALASIDSILADARANLPGNVDLAEPTSATRVKPELLPFWGNARATLAKIDHIAQTWKIVATALGRAIDPRFLPLVVADLSAEQLAALGPKPSASAVALAGHRLELATFASIAERQDRIRGEKQAAEDARPTLADGWRRTHGTGAAPIGRVGHEFKAPA